MSLASYPFTADEQHKIAMLSDEVQALQNNYPESFENFALWCDQGQIPEGTSYSHIEIYFGMCDVAAMEIKYGNVIRMAKSYDPDSQEVTIFADGVLVFISVEGHVLLDRTRLSPLKFTPGSAFGILQNQLEEYKNG